MLRAQPEMSLLRKMGLSGKIKNASNVNIGAVIIWPIKNNKLRMNSNLGMFRLGIFRLGIFRN